MKSKMNIKDSIFRITIAGLAMILIVTGYISFNKGIHCGDPYLDAYFASHPNPITNKSRTAEEETAMYTFMYNENMKIANAHAARIGGTVLDPGLTNSIINDVTRRINVYQGYVTSLQKQYKDAIAVGNIAYAQQCQNCINIWNTKIAEETNYLNTYKASIGMK